MRNTSPLIGLTGQTGAGKTQVCQIFAELGYDIINADYVTHMVMQAGSPCLQALKNYFDSSIINSDGSLNRQRAAEIIFSDAQKKLEYESIVFPHITAEVDLITERHRANNSKGIILDAPTLFESGIDKKCDYIVSVIAPVETRLKRILQRDNISMERAMQRISAQHDDNYYISRCDYVIINDGDLENLTKLVYDMLSGVNDEAKNKKCGG